MDLLAAFEGAVRSTAEVVKATPADLMDAPTPCTDWDVRALLNHVIGTMWLAEALFSDQPPRYPMVPGGLPPTDLAGYDPAAAYAEASAAALAAVSAGDALVRQHPTPLGEMPGPGLAGFTTLDILVHGWDLAKATGQPADLDGRLAAHVLGFAEQALTPDTRQARIGPALPAAADAPVTDRLVAFLGRLP
ncbi:MAG TPA: TIGR03086 family metal-binding protein [Streptosporangiaceae bacterium]|nr:TIGR03086 family metal-binding protein [Streptosporangiaceae bacterium]